MRTLICTFVLIASTSLLGAGQATPSAKPPVRTPVATPAAGPTAIIHTTVGNMRCPLYEKEAPIGVANFIGLANGTKDWTNPVSHAKKHGVPLYLVRLDATHDLSSARMRWDVRSAASPRPRWNADAPGIPAWRAELFRARAHPPGQ